MWKVVETKAEKKRVVEVEGGREKRRRRKEIRKREQKKGKKEEAKKLVSQKFYKKIYVYRKKAGERMSTRKI